MATLASVCAHRFLPHEHDESQGNHWPYLGAQRVCDDCGAVEVCFQRLNAGSTERFWYPKGFTPFVSLVPEVAS